MNTSVESASSNQQGWKSAQAVGPPFPWMGGKFYLANWIIEHFPEHRIFVEPFGGMANVLLKKRPSEIEIYNDIDGRLVNFFQVIRDKESFVELQRLCELTPYSREEFSRRCSSPALSNPVDLAYHFFICCRQARGGLGANNPTPNAWASSVRPRRQMPEPVSKYLSAIDGLSGVAERFRTVLIENLDAIKLIQKYDGEDALIYCDPPYPRSTLSSGKGALYAHDLSDNQHRELLGVLNQCSAKILISGYDTELYRELLVDWHCVRKKTHVQFSNSGQDRTECLWKNYD